MRENIKFLPSVKIPDGIKIAADIKKAAAGAEFIVLAVPSQFLRDVVKKLKSIDAKKPIFVSVTKGIENKTLLRMSEVVKDVLGDIKIGVLSGPSIAYEVAREMPTTVVAASSSAEVAKKIQDIFMTQRLRVYTSSDVVGVELGGALKNIIAIAAGVSDKLGFGTNAKAGLVTRGLVEMKRLGVAMGAQEKTFNGLSGLGDLITTCSSEHSRNRRVGAEVAQGKNVSEIEKETPMVAEGIRTSASVRELSKKYKVEMPIADQIYAILFENKDPLKAVSDLMLREKKAEG
jgi:glycerol-3-phosphate dehydrogenase (NAD(P)+)